MGCIELMELEMMMVNKEIERLRRELEWIDFKNWFNSQFKN